MNKAYLLFFLCIVSVILLSEAAFSSDYGNEVSTMWTMNGTLTYDATENGNNMSSNTGTQKPTGKLGSAINYDGSSTYSNTGFDMQGANQFSFAVWFKGNDSSGYFLAQDKATNDKVFRIEVATSNRLDLTSWDSGNNRKDVSLYFPTADDNWHFACGGWDGTNLYMAHDGNTTFTTTAMASLYGSASTKLTLGRREYNGGSGYYDGLVDEVALWKNYNLSNNDCNHIYNSGNGRQFENYRGNNMSGAPAATTYFQVTAKDHYDNSAINTFNITLDNGSFFNTTNGTVKTNINQSLGIIINFTVQATDYFNRTYYDVNTSSNLETKIWQALAYFNATQKITGEAVATFNATIGAKTNDSTPPLIRLKEGNYSATATASGYFNPSESIEVNISALDNTTFTFTGLYNHRLVINVTVLGGSATDQNFTVDIYGLNYTFHEQKSTTNGTLKFNLTENTTYQIYLNDSIHELDSANITLVPNNMITNYTFLVYTTNSFLFTFKNESSDTLLNNTNQTVYFSLISGVFSANYSTSNGTRFLELLVPADYTIRYYLDADVPREYYITLTNQSFNNITLYVIDEDISGFFLPKVQDEAGYACVNQTVSLLRHYITPNAYSVVEMAQTDTSGQAVLRVHPNIINYKLLFTGSCGTFVTQPQHFVAQTQTYTVSDSQSPLTSVVGIGNVSSSLTFNNATLTFVYSWTDATNLVTHGCLKIDKYKSGVMSSELDSCTAGATGSIIHTINDTNATRYLASTSLRTNSEYSEWPDKLKEVDFIQAFKNFGTLGLLLSLFVLLAFSFMALGSTERTVVSGVFAIVLMASFGFIFGSWVTLIGIIIVMVIIMYKSRT